MTSKEFLSDFINMYGDFPCLWKIKSKDYHNRQLKNKAYEELVNKLKEVDENASRETVIKKIDSLRGSFRRELKKMKKKNIFSVYLFIYLLLQDHGSDESPLLSPVSLETQATDDSLDESRDSSSKTYTPNTRTFKKPKQRNLCDSVLLRVQQELDSKKEKDEYDIVGKNVANKLRGLPKEVSLVAEKLITDILFEAQLGNINRNTR
ncbi:uncharacterized protein LOC126741360 [Anthonomus grandis grandis]|uniref:uncharacterized protein LOC126741360 n=1 Tax=Anthonomus grandis grandis TaxID=2921223 RepID=UPI00216519C5|nr:uncharacterized protein LOC126741360 [Anthonomus grandis grandis]